MDLENPNCGKTTLFNAYTGANLKVANWPGVTVEKVEGAIRDHNLNIRLVDLPGTYSLTSYTMEEQVSRQFILSDEVDMIIDVVDASALERNLYLTLQLLELGKPVVMALNMMDIVEKRGMEIDTHRLPEMLGIPVIPVSARKRTGLDVLLHAAAHHKDCNDPQCLVHHHKDQSNNMSYYPLNYLDFTNPNGEGLIINTYNAKNVAVYINDVLIPTDKLMYIYHLLRRRKYYWSWYDEKRVIKFSVRPFLSLSRS